MPLVASRAAVAVAIAAAMEVIVVVMEATVEAMAATVAATVVVGDLPEDQDQEGQAAPQVDLAVAQVVLEDDQEMDAEDDQETVLEDVQETVLEDDQETVLEDDQEITAEDVPETDALVIIAEDDQETDVEDVQDIVAHNIPVAREASKALVALPAGEALETTVATDIVAPEVQTDGEAMAGHPVTVLGDHPDGQDPATIQATVTIMVQVTHQAGSRFPTTKAFRSRFLTTMAAGAIIPLVQIFTTAMTTTMVRMSYKILAATI